MKIVKVIGGLGNQMFQFALYKALQKQHPDERILLDLHCFNGYHKHRGFEIEKVFGASFEKASLREVAQLAYPYPNFQTWRIGSRILPIRKTMLKEKADFTYEPSALTRSSSTYYDGYWQHEEYFKQIREELLDIFRFPILKDEKNLHTATKASTTNSCSLHIRRGDYLTDPLREGTISTDFAVKAIQEIRTQEQPETWFVFSDDIDWCKQHLSYIFENEDVTYIDWNNGNKSINDMHLMSLCRHHVIANSSFSWWGAWLSKRYDGITIAPSIWMNMKDMYSPVPDKWIKI